MMQDDVDFFQKTTLCGPDYDKAIEALCASMNPINTREANKRKALSLKDLLIKVFLLNYRKLVEQLADTSSSAHTEDYAI